MAEQTEVREPILADAADLLAQIVDANVRSLARTNDRIHESERASTAHYASAFAKLYDALDAIPDTIRTVHIDRLLTSLSHVRESADSLLSEETI